MNMIGRQWGTPFVTCFCPECQHKARDRGIPVERARQGYIALDRLFRVAHEEHRPTDGYFVAFWRTLLDYPEILAWEKLWTDSYHEIRAEFYGIAKAISPEKPLGFHIMHNNTLSPFYRAEENFSRTKDYADYVKQVVYNNCAGPRMAAFAAGSQGVVLSRKYSEMKLANLTGAGEGLREAGVV